MAEIYLNDIAHGRSGDKGDTSNVCVYARKPEYYAQGYASHYAISFTWVSINSISSAVRSYLR